MIGIVVVTHDWLADALVDAAGSILHKRPKAVAPVGIGVDDNVDSLRGKVARGIKEVDQKEGVLIMTDMFGGSPSNLSFSFLEEGRVEVLSGANLPMLVNAVKTRERSELGALAASLEGISRKSISLASKIIKGNKRG
ncbi:MAG: PTS fructose transporter subunit IIA [Desulfobacterales bacterium]|nr:PTS fructose transporter subunit IIA [Desulfobacterales bacterium]